MARLVQQTVKLTTATGIADLRIGLSTGNSHIAHEKAFSILVKDCIRRAIGNALGQSVLGILLSTGLLDDATDPQDFHRQLLPTFGNGAAVLERLIVKELYRSLNIPDSSQEHFEYGEALAVARDTLFVRDN